MGGIFQNYWSTVTFINEQLQENICVVVETIWKEIALVLKPIKCKQKEMNSSHCVLRCSAIQISQRRLAMLLVEALLCVKKLPLRFYFILNAASVAGCVVSLVFLHSAQDSSWLNAESKRTLFPSSIFKAFKRTKTKFCQCFQLIFKHKFLLFSRKICLFLERCYKSQEKHGPCSTTSGWLRSHLWTIG